ncbi:MAG TPA: DUF4097 family beta strand repeat-containing protein [Holophagaceae bacterium]|nr:DUF4097 family beta strand repeat-containing protein [Holophagaceae bacterium]
MARLSFALPAFLICAAALAGDAVVIQPAKAEKTTETRTVPLAAGSTFKAGNINGHVFVSAWDRNEVSFTGAFKPSSKGEQVKVTLESTAKGLEIHCEYPKHQNAGSHYHAPEVDLDLKVPQRVLASISTVNGDVSLEGTMGQATVSTVNGGVSAKNLEEGLKAESVNGALTLSHVLGALDASTVNGDIEARDLDGKGGGIRAESVNGSVHLTLGAAKGRVQASTTNGEVDFHAAGATDATIKRHKVSALLPGSEQSIHAETLNGGITID